jgi:hypothetical protein
MHLFVTCTSALCEQLHSTGLGGATVICQAPVSLKLTSPRPPMALYSYKISWKLVNSLESWHMHSHTKHVDLISQLLSLRKKSRLYMKVCKLQWQVCSTLTVLLPFYHSESLNINEVYMRTCRYTGCTKINQPYFGWMILS